MTILFFLIALGILIFVHEFGHFIVAKRAQVRVDEFSLGFGPRLIGVKKGDTDYRISVLPLGGYVKMLGEESEEEKIDDPRSFAKKSVWQRVKIIACGPLMNFLFSLLIMPVVFMIGRAEPVFLHQPAVVIDVRAESPAAQAGLLKGDEILAIDGHKIADWEAALNQFILSPGNTLKLTLKRGNEVFDKNVQDIQMPELKGGYVGVEPMLFLGNEAVINGVSANGPAARAGIETGDHVVSVNQKPISDWIDLSQKINEPGGKPVQLEIKRGEQNLAMEVTPEYNDQIGRWVIGIVKDRQSGVPMTTIRYGIVDAFVKGTQENLKLIGLTFAVLKRLFTLQLSYKVLGGPVIIAKASAAAAAAGISNFLYFLAFLSLQLSIINCLPIPVLDGGHLVFLGIEAVRRRPVSIKARQIASQVGFYVLIALMLVVTWNDLDSVFGLKTLIKKIF